MRLNVNVNADGDADVVFGFLVFCLRRTTLDHVDGDDDEAAAAAAAGPLCNFCNNNIRPTSFSLFAFVAALFFASLSAFLSFFLSLCLSCLSLCHFLMTFFASWSYVYVIHCRRQQVPLTFAATILELH